MQELIQSLSATFGWTSIGAIISGIAACISAIGIVAAIWTANRVRQDKLDEKKAAALKLRACCDELIRQLKNHLKSKYPTPQALISSALKYRRLIRIRDVVYTIKVQDFESTNIVNSYFLLLDHIDNNLVQFEFWSQKEINTENLKDFKSEIEDWLITHIEILEDLRKTMA